MPDPGPRWAPPAPPPSSPAAAAPARQLPAVRPAQPLRYTLRLRQLVTSGSAEASNCRLAPHTTCCTGTSLSLEANTANTMYMNTTLWRRP